MNCCSIEFLYLYVSSIQSFGDSFKLTSVHFQGPCQEKFFSIMGKAHRKRKKNIKSIDKWKKKIMHMLKRKVTYIHKATWESHGSTKISRKNVEKKDDKNLSHIFFLHFHTTKKWKTRKEIANFIYLPLDCFQSKIIFSFQKKLSTSTIKNPLKYALMF